MVISLTRRQLAQATGVGLAALAWPARAPGRQATPVPTGDPGWDAVSDAAGAVAPLAAYLASEIAGDTVLPIAGLHAERAQAVGSSFKLYILATLGEQVRDGRLDWGDRVEIQERYLSVPGGDLRYVEPGTAFTLRYIAERMIQKSDNTATDHAIAIAGREAVEAMFVTAGHATPARNVPLLTTREFAFMKFLYPAIDRYLAAAVPARREILETEIAPLDYDDLLAAAELQEAPLHIDTVEWFASPADLTNLMRTLKTMAASTFELQPLLEIMALETQLPLDGEVWPYAGFKGGSELGVLHGTWLLRRYDGRWFTLSIGFNDPAQGLDLNEAVAVMTAAMDQLARTP